MADLVKVKINNEAKLYPAGTVIETIAREYGEKDNVVNILATMNGKLYELHRKIKADCTIEFISTDTEIGNQAYKRSMTLLMLKAFYEVIGNKNIDKVVVQYSISKGYFCNYFGKIKLSESLLMQVENRMKELVEMKLPIRKRTINIESAKKIFKRHKMYDKYKLFEFKLSSEVNIYDIDGFEDYYYGFMAPNTEYLKYFKLYMYNDGFVLQMPTKNNPFSVPEFRPQDKIAGVLNEAVKWGSMIGISTAGDLNEQIVKENINDTILVQEALQEKKIAEIANKIADNKNVRFVMIAGPSSSGKTTFARRLGIQLQANGIRPYAIGVDDYYVNRDKSPKDVFGNNDYESLDAIDVKKLNEDMTDLLNGKRVEIPSFNFKTGKREYKGRYLQLEADDVLIIEGIHCLNDKLSYSLPVESKFKVYISALTQLNLDEHNRIATTDLRLIRRIVRDARTRGASAEETISMWSSVRRGEENNIFPYQETADVMFNSAMVYELAVLKQFAEPVLFGVPKDCREHLEAKRILKFLDYFIGVSSENVPENSLIREFIGGSCFN